MPFFLLEEHVVHTEPNESVPQAQSVSLCSSLFLMSLHSPVGGFSPSFRGCMSLCKDKGHGVMGALKPDTVNRDRLVDVLTLTLHPV